MTLLCLYVSDCQLDSMFVLFSQLTLLGNAPPTSQGTFVALPAFRKKFGHYTGGDFCILPLV
jgi:hypothetical protein